MRKYMVLIIGLFILGAVNVSIWHKEQLLANGKTVFLALAPVDPRSLMQGDYMALRFKLERDIAPQLTMVMWWLISMHKAWVSLLNYKIIYPMPLTLNK